jgi:hypothetical protein
LNPNFNNLNPDDYSLLKIGTLYPALADGWMEEMW